MYFIVFLMNGLQLKTANYVDPNAKKLELCFSQNQQTPNRLAPH